MTDIITSIIVLVTVITIAAVVFTLIWKKGFSKHDNENESYEHNSIEKKHFQEPITQEATVKPWLKIESGFTHEVVFYSKRLDEKYGLLCGSGANCDIRLNSPMVPEEFFKLANDEKGFYLNSRAGRKLRLVDGTEKTTVDLPAEGIQLVVGSDVVSITFPCVQKADQPQTLVRRLE